MPPNSTRTSSTDNRAIAPFRSPGSGVRNVLVPRRLAAEDSCTVPHRSRRAHRSIHAISRAERRSVVILFTTRATVSTFFRSGGRKCAGASEAAVHGPASSLAASPDAHGRWEAEPGRLGCGRTRKSGGCVSTGRAARRSISSARSILERFGGDGITSGGGAALWACPSARCSSRRSSSPRSSATPRSPRRSAPVAGSGRDPRRDAGPDRARHRDGARRAARTADHRPRALRDRFRDRRSDSRPRSRASCESIPLAVEGERVHVACADPLHASALEQRLDRSARGAGRSSSSRPRTRSSGRSTHVYSSNADIDDALRDFEDAGRGAPQATRRDHRSRR